ncbi:MAG TPA: zinc ribbon domain-containing protein, partial [Gemmatirosa sp.]
RAITCSFPVMTTSAHPTPPPTAAATPAAVRPRYCAACGAALSAGANYCHRCGTAVVAASDAHGAGTPRARGRSVAEVAPWAVAFVAFLALAAMAAGRNLGAARGSGLDAPQNALPQASLGEGGAAGGGAGGGAGEAAAGPGAGGAPFAPFAGGGTGRPPDLSTMTPRDIADRLFDRVMRLSGEGKVDSAQFFATMALQNYDRMPAAGVPFDADLRYDMGRIAEVAGRGDIAAAQADTILRANPTHLLGLVLAIKGAALQGDRARLTDAQRRLIAAAPAERAKNLEEYQRHGNDIDAALKLATSTGPVAPR